MFILMVAYGISGLLFVYVISFLTTLLDDSYPVVFILNFFSKYSGHVRTDLLMRPDGLVIHIFELFQFATQHGYFIVFKYHL